MSSSFLNRANAVRTMACIVVAAAAGVGASTAKAQSCPSGSTYYTDTYTTGCTGGSCWATTPFPGSQSGAPIGWPGWYYSCTLPPAEPPPPGAPSAPSGRLFEFGYDLQGNLTSVKDPLNHTTTNQYDALNRLKQVTSSTPISAVTQYGYNGLDALTSVTDPRSLVTSYTVNGLGDLGQQVSPDTGTTTNTYDAAGNLLTQTDAKSQVTTYAYDALNRVTSITFHDGSSQTYGYDSGTNGIGRLTSIIERNASSTIVSQIAYAYDAHGRLTSDTRTLNSVAYATTYRYDSYGRRDRITYPSGRTVDFTFDTLGRISGVSTTALGGSAQTLASSITYHPFGGVTGFTFGNSQTYSRSIDLDGRITTYTLGGAGYSVGHDAANRIEFMTETANPTNTNSYSYDNADRLTSAVTPGTAFSYGYDGVGNRTSTTIGAGSATYAYATTSNRIASITPSSGPVRSFTFDANGSTTADGVNTYTYDVRGRMVSATSSIGTTTYQLNALGQRVRKTNSLADRIFTYDAQGQLIAENTAAGALLREYLWLGNVPLAVIHATGIYYVHVDHLNTPRVVANQAGQAVWRWDHQEPFGVNVSDENPSGLGIFDLPLRLPGQYFDKETNLHYNYFRDYEPSLGRYGESDPIGLKGGVNTYAYVYGDPLSLTDALGLEPPGTMRQRGYFGPRKCPMRPPENDSDWRRYTRRTGEVVFHCGFTCYIEKKVPLNFDPQGECCYDEKNVLVDECHKYAGCRGTPNQYDADTDPGKHFWSDSGGIVGSGGPAFNESNRHRRDNLKR